MITDFSQCDKALKDKLKGFMLNGEEVPVMYINPEKEVQDHVTPSIAIYGAGIYPDNYRWTNEKFYDNPTYDSQGELDTVEEREAPIPHNMYYGIRLYYEFFRDGVELKNFIHRTLKRGSYLEIGGDQYEIFFVSYKNPNSTYKDFGEQKENERREMVEQYLYKVEADLDVGTRRTVKVSKELDINVQPKNQP